MSLPLSHSETRSGCFVSIISSDSFEITLIFMNSAPQFEFCFCYFLISVNEEGW